MSNETDMDQGEDIQIFPLGNCKFAYTINSEQPVRCTWISDQPLFYSSVDEEALSDEILSDDPVFQALERDILQLRAKTSAYEKISTDFVKSSDAKLESFIENGSSITGTYIKSSQSDLLEYLHQSRFASLLLSFAATNQITLTVSTQVPDAVYDRDAKTVLYRHDLNIVDQALSVVRELRRVYHHKNGAGLHPLALHPDHAVIVNRAQNADLSVAIIRAAWELQLAGCKDSWARIESSTLNDIGRAFAREACSDFRSINNGVAAKSCLETWFLSERCRKTDRVLIQQMLAEYQGYVFADNPEASRSITHDLLRVLGQMPFGANYLVAHVNQMMADPVFTDVRDRSNANFLWFIKFERAFKDAETNIEQKNSSKSGVKTSKMMKESFFESGATILAWPKLSSENQKIQKVKKTRRGSTNATILPFHYSDK
jgi:hypothetical protein